MAEGGGLLNRCTVKSRTGGSNPPLSAILSGSNLFNYLDRYVACQVVEAIRLSFGSSDGQAGCLNAAFMPGCFLPAPVLTSVLRVQAPALALG